MIYFLAPAYNEAKNIPHLARSLSHSANFKFRLIIVDDGSTDSTRQVVRNLARRYPLKIIGYKNNRGPGFAFKYGFDYITKYAKDADLIITIEADNSSDLAAVDKMRKLVKNYDVVLASPIKMKNGLVNIKFHRKILTYANHYVTDFFFRIRGVDSYGNFFRIYRVSAIKNLKKAYGKNYLTEDGFSAVSEILVKLHKVGASFTSFPAQVNWTKRKGQSKMKIAKYIRSQILFIIKYWLLSTIFLKSK
jgi:dolichol-phosphate mannosyltransferase